MRALSFLSVLVLMSGCASWVKEWIPGAEPVTVERCQALDMKEMGLKDGQLGQRRGDKYEFWMKDCRSLKAPLDKSLYDQGYDLGLLSYCSCEKGFAAGIREEFLEMRGQYTMCSRKEFAGFSGGHEAGKKFSKDPSMVKQEGPYKYVYTDEIIEAKAKEECPAIMAKVEKDAAEREAKEAANKGKGPKAKAPGVE